MILKFSKKVDKIDEEKFGIDEEEWGGSEKEEEIEEAIEEEEDDIVIPKARVARTRSKSRSPSAPSPPNKKKLRRAISPPRSPSPPRAPSPSRSPSPACAPSLPPKSPVKAKKPKKSKPKKSESGEEKNLKGKEARLERKKAKKGYIINGKYDGAIPKAPFFRLLRETFNQFSNDIKIQAVAAESLKEEVEKMIINEFDDAHQFSALDGRVTVQVKDLQVLKRIKERNGMYPYGYGFATF